MRLGDLDALKDAINFGISDAPTYIKATVDQYIDEAPTIVAVPVFRCRECRYYQDAKPNKKGFLICPASGMEITETDYCSYGALMDGKETSHA